MPRPKKSKPNRSDNRFEYKLTTGKTLEGKLIRKSFYSQISMEDAKRQAQEWSTQKKAEELSGIQNIQSNKLFVDWAKVWLETYKRGKVKDSTYQNNYAIPLRLHLNPHFGMYHLEDIKPANIQEFFNLKSKDGCALETMKKMRVCLHSIFETAVENDLCRKNPVTRNISLVSNKEPEKKDTYAPEQVEIVREYAKTHPNGLPVILMLDTGISRSELLGLMWGDIDFQEKTMHINRGAADVKSSLSGKWEVVVGAPKNDFRRRVVPIDDEVVAMLQAKFEDRAMLVNGSRRKKIKPTLTLPDFIFPSAKGEVYSPNNWSIRVFNRFMDDLQEAHPEIPKLSPHELRHTFATNMRNNGADLFALALIMGHADFDMLYKRYAHIDLQSLRKAMSHKLKTDDKLTTKG